ncbi:MAG TPA: TlpA disulfide reductase family protein [Thermoanaerobaculia bacterium]|jgi:peroxiredoxin|nr:TlpA disulfide reductase family protein [Thermoanaerobaculia bacterium]
MKKIALVLVLVVAVTACKREKTSDGFGYGKSDQKTTTAATATGTEVGALMPEYTAANLDGSKFDLAGKRGKVVLVNLWATWCGPCRYEIPELQRIHDAYTARGFEVVGVSVDEGEVATVQAFVEEQKMRYPVAHDPQGTLANVLQTSVLPTSILIDRNGKIVWKKVGAIFEKDEELKSAIEKAL